MPAADYLCLSRGGGVYSVRVSWVFGSSNSGCLFQFISCTAVRSILQTVGLGGEKTEILKYNCLTYVLDISRVWLVCRGGEEGGSGILSDPS